MSLCAAVLISSEFLPVSLLTPLASELKISEGHAGQSISVSGFFALITSLFIGSLIGAMNRRSAVLIFTGLMIVSGIIVAFSPNAAVLMAGRALLGISVGGFWSISAAIIMRLVPADAVPKALALLNGGNAVAATLAAPLGSYLGSMIGWRATFLSLVPLALIALVWQWISLPSLPAEKPAAKARDAFALLCSAQVALGISGVGLFFLGQFALFTYLRPFLDIVTDGNAALLSGLLLVTGAAGAAGTLWIGQFLRTHLYSLLIIFPVLMSLLAFSLATIPTTPVMTLILLIGWGFIGTAAPVAWWTWLSRSLPQDAEAGGGLMVAVIQLAITLGAVMGGVFFDTGGYPSAFIFAAAVLLLAALIAVCAHRASLRNTPQTQTS